jgi:hypothetical protein
MEISARPPMGAVTVAGRTASFRFLFLWLRGPRTLARVPRDAYAPTFDASVPDDDEAALEGRTGVVDMWPRVVPMLAHCARCHHARIDHPGGSACTPVNRTCNCARFAPPSEEEP